MVLFATSHFLWHKALVLLRLICVEAHHCNVYAMRLVCFWERIGTLWPSPAGAAGEPLLHTLERAFATGPLLWYSAASSNDRANPALAI